MSDIELKPHQIRAITGAIEAGNIYLITGGAGAGKTTIIEEIVKRETEQGNPVNVCALAGKAAARVRENGVSDASTIHSMLGYKGEFFSLETLAGVTVIIDEASMVSSDILYQIIKRNPKKLILVGDDAQLPPVGNGRPFYDILKSVHSSKKINLDFSFRASGAIYEAGERIRRGEFPSNGESGDERFQFCPAGTHSYPGMIEYIADVFDPTQDTIIAPSNGQKKKEDEARVGSVAWINNKMKERLNPRDKYQTIRKRNAIRDYIKFDVGDKVINKKNRAEDGIWNGDTGFVESLNRDEIVIDFGGRTVATPTTGDLFFALDLAYAITIHKSQGSEYRNVYVIVQKSDQYMLDRNLIYTAVTRAKKSCFVIGDMFFFKEAIKRVRERETVFNLLNEAVKNDA